MSIPFHTVAYLQGDDDITDSDNHRSISAMFFVLISSGAQLYSNECFAHLASIVSSIFRSFRQISYSNSKEHPNNRGSSELMVQGIPLSSN